MTSSAASIASSDFVSSKWIEVFPDDLSSIASVLQYKKLSGTSDIVSEYEGALAEWFGVRFCVAVSSGSSALIAALKASGAGPGTEIVIPCTAPIPSVLPILALGATPVAVDTEPDSFGLSLDRVAEVINPRTRALLVVPVWGYGSNERAVQKIAIDAGIPMIEDAAQAHGSTIGGQKLGTIGTVGCFSTHDNKPLSTGEGGFLLTNDEGFYRRLRSICHLGGLDGKHFGFNFKLGALAAGLGLKRLGNLERIISGKRAVAQKLTSALRPYGFLEVSAQPENCPNRYSLVLRTPNSDGDELRHYLHDRGIESDIIKYGYRLIYEHSLFQGTGNSCRNAEALLRTSVTLPTHPGVSLKVIDRIVEYLSDTRRIG